MQPRYRMESVKAGRLAALIRSPEAQPMHLLLVSDTHLSRETQAFAENWRVVREHIEAAPPDLIVHLGDISVDGGLMSNW